MLLFHKGCCNFSQDNQGNRSLNLRDFGIVLLSFSCGIGSPLPSDILTVEEANRKSNNLPKVRISKWKSSTKLIADKSRILSASVAIPDHVGHPACPML